MFQPLNICICKLSLPSSVIIRNSEKLKVFKIALSTNNQPLFHSKCSTIDISFRSLGLWFYILRIENLFLIFSSCAVAMRAQSRNNRVQWKVKDGKGFYPLFPMVPSVGEREIVFKLKWIELNWKKNLTGWRHSDPSNPESPQPLWILMNLLSMGDGTEWKYERKGRDGWSGVEILKNRFEEKTFSGVLNWV